MDFDVHETELGKSIRIGCEFDRWIAINVGHAVEVSIAAPGRLQLRSKFYRITVECVCGKDQCDAVAGFKTRAA